MSTRTSLSFEELKRLRQLQSNVINGIPVDLPDDLVKYWNLNTKELHLKLGDLLFQRSPKSNLVIPYPYKEFGLSIFYGTTIKELVKDGNYDWASSDVSAENFEEDFKEDVKDTKVFLINFKRSISSRDAISEMDKYGLRPAALKELLSFGFKYPDEQKKNPIVALGSCHFVIQGTIYATVP
ncbi:hypothetical protein GYA37_01825 [candidate division WWE3 bacterium]|uniref:Uncharacterized protein n=1 Tax=candidate division WWE3 bacterium TaxID=2053526 RepID=A0A7X9E6Z9_UNCKA|nr:hypothetical protein [candidate division WWE3 bacterium]